MLLSVVTVQKHNQLFRNCHLQVIGFNQGRLKVWYPRPWTFNYISLLHDFLEDRNGIILKRMVMSKGRKKIINRTKDACRESTNRRHNATSIWNIWYRQTVWRNWYKMHYIPLLKEDAFRRKHVSRFLRNVLQNYQDLVFLIYTHLHQGRGSGKCERNQ